MKTSVVLLILAVFAVLVSGCVFQAEQLPTATEEYVVKEKFQSVDKCGYGSATRYNILTTDGEVIIIAGECGGRTDRMRYYYMWSDLLTDKQEENV